MWRSLLLSLALLLPASLAQENGVCYYAEFTADLYICINYKIDYYELDLWKAAFIDAWERYAFERCTPVYPVDMLLGDEFGSDCTGTPKCYPASIAFRAEVPRIEPGAPTPAPRPLPPVVTPPWGIPAPVPTLPPFGIPAPGTPPWGIPAPPSLPPWGIIPGCIYGDLCCLFGIGCPTPYRRRTQEQDEEISMSEATHSKAQSNVDGMEPAPVDQVGPLEFVSSLQQSKVEIKDKERKMQQEFYCSCPPPGVPEQLPALGQQYVELIRYLGIFAITGMPEVPSLLQYWPCDDRPQIGKPGTYTTKQLKEITDETIP